MPRIFRTLPEDAPRGHIIMDLRELQRGYGYIRAPGGGPQTSGLNEQVRAQIGASPHYQRLLNQLYDCTHTMAMNLSEIHVAIGCTWGNHRSVAMVEDLGTSLCYLPPTFDFHVDIWHLDQFRWAIIRGRSR